MKQARYTEPKARSAELLRLALGHMGRHEAAFNPVTFTVWYEVAAAVNAPLTDAIEALVAQSLPVDDEAILRLYQEHVAPADAQAIDRVSHEMLQLMSTVAGTATHAGTQAGAFGLQLADLSEALASQDVDTLAPRLNEALAGTAGMKAAASALAQRLTHSQDEIARLRSALARARGEALLDPLTGILNRKGFDQKLQELVSSPLPDDACHCLVMLDIDHFKKVNDTHGHLIGDRVIQGVAEILRKAVTNPAHAAARYGGEEFAILLPQTPLPQCLALAESVRLRTKAMRLRHRQTQEVLGTISISAGVAALRAGDDAAALIARADAALYRSKAEGRDRLTCA